MIRIASVNLPGNKRVKTALTYIYGIGEGLSQKIITQAKIEGNPLLKELTAEQFEAVRTIIEKNMVVETDLRQQINQNIRRLKDIGCYRGIRHKKNLPVRGQRTRTNARTKRGKRVTVGSGRRKPAEKT